MRNGVWGAALAVLAAGASAQADDTELAEVVIHGRGEHLLGTAQAASEGTVGGADLGVRPLLRVAELLEVVPGLIAAQHSGSGKANQYFLRGFNLDHGTDFAVSVDDVPLNLRTHGHGQGYLDVNGLIPELVERIDFRKGPYRADSGDHALAGAARMQLAQDLGAPFVSLEGGELGWRRVAGGGTGRLGVGELTLAGQWKRYDGPWQLPEDLRHFAGYARYAGTLQDGTRAELSWSGYDATWHPTEQIPERAIGTALCADVYCAIDRSATGSTERHILALRLLGGNWRAVAWAQSYDWNMFSDPTYAEQIHQWDRRHIYGASAQRAFATQSSLSWLVGADTRYDDISKVQVDHTDQRQFVDYIAAHRAREFSLAAWAEATWHPVDALRVTGGLRGDHFSFRTRATQPGFSGGNATDRVLSPKLALAWQFAPHWEAYANWGRGFHSNDARGVTAFDPPVAGLVRGTGKELGLRFQQGTFSLTTTYWWLSVDSELKFVGDSNSVEPGAASRRRGLELVSFWRPLPRIAVDATWTVSRARYHGPEADPTAPYIAGAIESAGELGVSYIDGAWELSARLRHLGPYPLTEDNGERARAEDVVNLRAAWKRGPWMLYGELLNVFDSSGKDIVYWYESSLPAIDPPGGVDCTAGGNCRMSRTVEPRTVRLGLRYRL